MTTEYTVRKCRVVGKLSDHDWNRLVQELDTQHRNKNKFIGIDQARRSLVRQAQSEHPTIGMLTAQYNKLKGEKLDLMREAQAPFEAPLNKVNAKIRDAKKNKIPVSRLVTERKEIELARKKAGSNAAAALSEKLLKLAGKLRDVKEKSRRKVAKIRSGAQPIRAAIAELNIKIKAEPNKAKRDKLKAQKTQCVKQLRAIKEQANEHDIYATINQHTEELKKLACRDMSDEEAQQYGFKFGLAGHSGTKWWIKENADQAAKDRSRNMAEAQDPKFLRFQPHYLSGEIREGTLCAGISQSGPSGPVASYNSPTKSKLFIPQPVATSAYDKRALRRGERKRAQRADMYFRIGTAKVYDEETGKMVERPEWIHLPSVGFHHEFPADAVVVETLLKLETVGVKQKLWVIFTLKAEPPKPIIPETMESVVIKAETQVGDGALVYARSESSAGSLVLWHNTDPCQRIRKWNKLGGKTSGVRRDESGVLRKYVNGKVAPSKELTDLYTYTEGITRTQTDWLGLSKEGQDRIKSKFDTTVLGYIASSDKLPPCLAEAASNNIFLWKSTGRLQRLYRQWTSERVEGDEEAFDAMKEWADHDLHLYQWSRSMTARLTRRKIDTFRKDALKLCRTYKTVYIDDVDTRGREDGFTEDQATERTKWDKRASFGLFREILKKTAKRCGTELVVGIPEQQIAA